MFDLFLEKSGHFYDEDGYWGKIIINDFNERFFRIQLFSIRLLTRSSGGMLQSYF